MSDTTGFGVIGAGIWGELHARTYATTPGARLAALCDLDSARLSAVDAATGGGAAALHRLSRPARRPRGGGRLHRPARLSAPRRGHRRGRGGQAHPAREAAGHHRGGRAGHHRCGARQRRHAHGRFSQPLEPALPRAQDGDRWRRTGRACRPSPTASTTRSTCPRRCCAGRRSRTWHGSWPATVSTRCSGSPMRAPAAMRWRAVYAVARSRVLRAAGHRHARPLPDDPRVSLRPGRAPGECLDPARRRALRLSS